MNSASKAENPKSEFPPNDFPIKKEVVARATPVLIEQEKEPEAQPAAPADTKPTVAPYKPDMNTVICGLLILSGGVGLLAADVFIKDGTIPIDPNLKADARIWTGDRASEFYNFAGSTRNATSKFLAELPKALSTAAQAEKPVKKQKPRRATISVQPSKPKIVKTDISKLPEVKMQCQQMSAEEALNLVKSSNGAVNTVFDIGEGVHCLNPAALTP